MMSTTDTGRRRELTRLAAVLDHAYSALGVLLPDERERSARPGFFTRTKLAAETALLFHAAARVDTGHQLDAQLEALASRLAAASRSPELLAWARLRPAIIPELSVAHCVLTAHGYGDEATGDALASAASASSVAPVERLPWKQIERSWQARIGAPTGPYQAVVDLDRTALGCRQDALFATRDEVYGLTHALIYHTDFGHRTAPLPRPGDEIADDAGSALARCLDDDDFDLGAEVLFTWPYLRRPWSPAAAFGLRVLRHVDDTVGYLPSMTIRPEELSARQGSDLREYWFQEAYHTVYVMGLLTAATLASDVDTTPPLAENRVGARYAEKLRSLTAPSPDVRQWEDVYDTLTAAQRGALVPLLADIATRRACRTGDFGALPGIVSVAAAGCLAAGVEPSVGMEQAGELIRRLAA